MSTHYRKDKTCLNCGHAVQEYYCSHCGQENLETKESFAHLVTHYVADYLHFDSKFFRTLFPLFFKPGKLTKEYVAGRRTRYVHPFRLFIFTTIIYYLVFGFLDPYAKPAYTSLVDRDSTHETILLYGDTATGSMTLSFPILKDIKTVEEYERMQDTATGSNKHGSVGRYMAKKLIPLRAQPIDAAKMIVNRFVKNLTKLVFVLLPVFALLVMLAYRRRRKFYMEHAIFSVHIHTFFFALLLFLVILQAIVPFRFELVAALLTFIYLFAALKRTYGGRFFPTFLRLSAIMFMYGIVLVLCLFGNFVIAFIML